MVAESLKRILMETMGVDMIKTHCLHVCYSQRINDTYLMVKMCCNIVVSANNSSHNWPLIRNTKESIADIQNEALYM